MTSSRSAPRRLAAVALFLVGVTAFVAIIYFLGLDKVDTLLDSDLRFVALAFGVGLPMTMTTAFLAGSLGGSGEAAQPTTSAPVKRTPTTMNLD